MGNSLASMTGYARGAGSRPGVVFTLEMKSVNGRGLEMRTRLAPGFDGLEAEIRRIVGKRITRGSLTISLSIAREGEEGRVAINHQALEAVIAGVEWLKTRVDAERPRIDGLLALKGVVEQHQLPLPPDEEEALNAAILTLCEQVVANLEVARREEGRRIAEVLATRLDEIETFTAAAEAHPGRSREAVLARLRQQIADLLQASSGLSEERLAQEAVLLATKSDIREELDRLTAHVAAARALLRDGGPVGRKLDFLSQEFNREANTLCSKSNDVALTAIGLDLKAAIDQLREQVQNIE
jgi:uncharacterized protein (TIGR00255 family)